MRLVFLGQPGAGKGTQAQLVCQRRGIAHISTGEMLREHMASATPIGVRAREFYDRGELVPDGLILEMVEQRLAAEDCQPGFLLDGFPRTREQAIGLDEVLGNGQNLNKVVLLEVSEDEIIRRLTSRNRMDDTPEVIRKRIEVYHQATAGAVSHYESQGKLARVSGEGSIEEIYQRVKECVT